VIDEFDRRFPALQSMEDIIGSASVEVVLEPGQFICMEGDACQSLALVMKGTARVYKMSEGGREITLYRVRSGESCILTTSCILGDRLFPAFAVAETSVEARVVPATMVQAWMEEHADWRAYVFELMAERLGAVIATLEEVAFRSLDARLAVALLDRVEERQHGARVRSTHEKLAADLGTAREVVSRLLKDLEHDGAVALHRGSIEIKDRATLVEQSRL
jgi:CRP/FNR family transcriptional regulator